MTGKASSCAGFTCGTPANRPDRAPRPGCLSALPLDEPSSSSLLADPLLQSDLEVLPGVVFAGHFSVFLIGLMMSGSVVGGGLGRRLLKAFSQACSSRSAGRASALALRHLLHDEDKVAPLSKARRGDHWPAGWTDAPRKTRCGHKKGTSPSLIHRLIGHLRHLRQFARRLLALLEVRS